MNIDLQAREIQPLRSTFARVAATRATSPHRATLKPRWACSPP